MWIVVRIPNANFPIVCCTGIQSVTATVARTCVIYIGAAYTICEIGIGSQIHVMANSSRIARPR